MARSHRLITSVWTLACCIAFACPVVALADTARFEIKAEPLSVALKAFAQQAHMQLLYEYAIVRKVSGNPVNGLMDKHAALEELLRNTGLEVIFNSDDAATIRLIRSTNPAEMPSHSGRHGSGKATKTSRGVRMAAMNDGTPEAADSNTSGKRGFDDQEPPASLAEVIVTAQKRRQRAFDVPISLITIGAQTLQRREVISLNDLPFEVPGLVVQGGGAQRRIVMRGISNNSGNGALVGTYIDEADATSEGISASFGYGEFDLRSYDLARIEVLRGPQGTLYGEGSMGGTIRFITNKPVLDEFQMNADVSALFNQNGAPSQRTVAVLNTPVLTNVLGLRFAGEVDHDGGWIDQPAANLKNINSQNLVDARVEGLWQPIAALKINAMQIIHRNSYGLDVGEDASGNYTQYFDLTTTPHGQANSNLSNLAVTYDFSHARLLSSTTYFDHSINNVNWGEGLPSGLELYYPYYPVSDKDLSDELRLTRSDDAPWQWTIGGFYKNYRDNLSYKYYVGPPGALPVSYVTYSVHESSKSWSAFGDTSYKLGPLTVGTGLRYFNDDETSTIIGSAAQQATFTSADPRFYLRYGVTKDINVYLSAAKGFRSGGFNAQGVPPYHPEDLWTYELGTKIRSPERRVTADADVFFSNYSNYVIIGFTPSNPINFYHNAGTARIKGFEGSATWEPVDRLRVSVNGDYLDAAFVKINLLGSPYRVGDVLPFVSKCMINASLDRDFQVSRKPAFAELEYSITGREHNKTGGVDQESDVMHMLDFNTGMDWSDSLRFGVFVKNLLDDRGFLYASQIFKLTPRAQPRTFGVDFAVMFN
jgi:iron complex outermembrane recepter protein